MQDATGWSLVLHAVNRGNAEVTAVVLDCMASDTANLGLISAVPFAIQTRVKIHTNHGYGFDPAGQRADSAGQLNELINSGRKKSSILLRRPGSTGLAAAHSGPVSEARVEEVSEGRGEAVLECRVEEEEDSESRGDGATGTGVVMAAGGRGQGQGHALTARRRAPGPVAESSPARAGNRVHASQVGGGGQQGACFSGGGGRGGRGGAGVYGCMMLRGEGGGGGRALWVHAALVREGRGGGVCRYVLREGEGYVCVGNVCVCGCVCARVCTCVCVCSCVHVCVCMSCITHLPPPAPCFMAHLTPPPCLWLQDDDDNLSVVSGAMTGQKSFMQKSFSQTIKKVAVELFKEKTDVDYQVEGGEGKGQRGCRLRGRGGMG